MFCQGCGTQLQEGLSYCNRCGANLKDRGNAGGAMIGAFLTAMVVIALGGLGIMLGGAVVLTKEALLKADAVGIFMLMTFLVVVVVEVFLGRQLSRLTGGPKQQKPGKLQSLSKEVNQILPAQGGLLGEPIGSVTENTTRTLDYVRNDAQRR